VTAGAGAEAEVDATGGGEVALAVWVADPTRSTSGDAAAGPHPTSATNATVTAALTRLSLVPASDPSVITVDRCTGVHRSITIMLVAVLAEIGCSPPPSSPG
jgi:hypothetical protein